MKKRIFIFSLLSFLFLFSSSIPVKVSAQEEISSPSSLSTTSPKSAEEKKEEKRINRILDLLEKRVTELEELEQLKPTPTTEVKVQPPVNVITPNTTTTIITTPTPQNSKVITSTVSPVPEPTNSPTQTPLPSMAASSAETDKVHFHMQLPDIPENFSEIINISYLSSDSNETIIQTLDSNNHYSCDLQISPGDYSLITKNFGSNSNEDYVINVPESFNCTPGGDVFITVSLNNTELIPTTEKTVSEQSINTVSKNSITTKSSVTKKEKKTDEKKKENKPSVLKTILFFLCMVIICLILFFGYRFLKKKNII